MDKNLILLAAKAVIESYKNNIDLGTTEYSLTVVKYQNKLLQILAMPGTNEMADWLWNFHLWSREGVKRCTYLAAQEVYNAVAEKINPNVPLLVTGHSKAGPDALWFKANYGATYCVSFCPAPAFRRSKIIRLKNTTIVLDLDDLVPKAGIINFTHPVVENIVKLPRDKKRYDIKGRMADHDMIHIYDDLQTYKFNHNYMKQKMKYVTNGRLYELLANINIPIVFLKWIITSYFGFGKSVFNFLKKIVKGG